MKKTTVPRIDPSRFSGLKAQNAGRRNLISVGYYRPELREKDIKIVVSENRDATPQAKAEKVIEAHHLSACDHANIVRVYGIVDGIDPNVVDVIMEYCDSGCLDDYLDNLKGCDRYTKHRTTPELLKLSLDVASALQYLHTKSLYPKTLAANSILLTFEKKEKKAMLFKVGQPCVLKDLVALESNDDQLARYAAPELQKSKNKQTVASDVWSFGVLLWQIFKLGEIPYSDCSYDEATNLISQGKKLLRPKCLAAIGDLMESCWKSPMRRPGLNAIINQIVKGYHGWLDFEIPNILENKITDISAQPFSCGVESHVFEGKYYSRRGDGLTENVAIKISLKDKLDVRVKMVNEANLLRQCDHINILQVYGLMEGFEHDCIGIVMELCDGLSLVNMLSVIKAQFTTPTVRTKEILRIADDILSASVYLDKNGLVHRFLAPQSVLLKRKDYTFSWKAVIHKIGDPEKKADKELIEKFARWAAPELFKGIAQTSKCDVWSFGVTLWQMLMLGEHPYSQIPQDAFVVDFTLEGGTLQQIQDCPPLLQNMMNKCWKKNPDDRPAFRKLYNDLHKFANEKGVFNTLRADKNTGPAVLNPGINEGYRMMPVSFMPVGTVPPAIPNSRPTFQQWSIPHFPMQEDKARRSMFAQTIPRVKSAGTSALPSPPKQTSSNKGTYMEAKNSEQQTKPCPLSIDFQEKPKPKEEKPKPKEEKPKTKQEKPKTKQEKIKPKAHKMDTTTDLHQAQELAGLDEDEISAHTMDFLSIYNLVSEPQSLNTVPCPVENDEPEQQPDKIMKVNPRKMMS